MPRRGENIRKRKDGRWEARYPKGKNKNGHTIYGAVYGNSYKEAKEKRHHIQQQNTRVTRRSDHTFRELLCLWVEDSQIRLKASTVYRYQYLIDTHILPVLGDLPVDGVSEHVIHSFLLDKLHSGRLDGSGGLSASYVRSITLVIGSALRYGAQHGLCSATDSHVSKPALLQKDLPILTKENQALLESTLSVNTDETKLGVYISLYAGLRIGEICALSWKDVDLKNRIIYVRNTVVRVKSSESNSKKTHLTIDKPKTSASYRSIPICSALLPVLNVCAEKAVSPFVVSRSTDFVSPRTYDYRYKKILKESGVPNINYHALRHTFATRCIEAGVDVKSLSEILGHANVSITLNTYVHSSMDLKRMQLEKLSELAC